MRYPEGHKAQTHERILDAAAKVFRQKGFVKATVEDVMTEADLTVGGFYAHFKSKDDLFTEMLRRGLEEAARNLETGDKQASGTDRAKRFLERYLSTLHRRHPDKGCPMPPLLSEMTRAKGSSEKAFETVVELTAHRLEGYLEQEDNESSRPLSLALVAMCVGGIALSRAVSDETFGEEILAACREIAIGLLEE